ncbi:DDE-type integrase/transposase/recombinase [Zooshikella sp. RANM57]|uniref:DDE-type integrase/transposase/recombinase n=1 Tax=Zooshikella sp. RANM57 TaxID=3425863 RepID=UPI003D6E4C0C
MSDSTKPYRIIHYFHKKQMQWARRNPITIDGSAANKAAAEAVCQERYVTIEIRQTKYLNNRVEQDHRGIKRITRSMLGFKSFRSARSTLISIERVYQLRKTLQVNPEAKDKTLFEQFCSLAG